MSQSNILIKQHINFLEFPLWMVDPIQDEYGLIWKDKNSKYIYRSNFKAPDKTDQVFLYRWLLESQKNNWAKKIALSGYRILKDCGGNDTKWWYDRLEDSFWRWKGVTIGFKDCFYNSDKKEYKSKIFGIIEGVLIEKGKIQITFNDDFLYEIKETNFCNYINFEEIKKLRNPTASRLHEILCKTFKGRNEWSIDAHKLANKIPMQEKYLSDIISKIKPAINRINSKTTLKIDLEIRKKERGKAVLVFRKTNPSIQYNPKKQEKEPKKLKKEVKNDLYRQFLKSAELNDMRYVSLIEIAKIILPKETNQDILNKKAFQIFCEEQQELLNF